MVDPNCARSKLEKMHPNKGKSANQYHVRLWLKVVKCGITDLDDVIQSKILQTMRDKKLHQLLEHTGNKEDVDCQAQPM